MRPRGALTCSFLKPSDYNALYLGVADRSRTIGYVHCIGGASLCRACVFPRSFTSCKLPSEKPRASRSACLSNEREVATMILPRGALTCSFLKPSDYSRDSKAVCLLASLTNEGLRPLSKSYRTYSLLLITYYLSFPPPMYALNVERGKL